VALVVALAASSGCGGPRMEVFTNPEADLSFYEKVGVMPFRSLTADRLAGEKFTTEFTTALLAAELFDVMDYGVFVSHVGKVLGTRSPVEGGLSADDIKRIATNAGVQGVFVGSVSDYQMTSTQSGQFPVITVEVRLLDAETANVVWSASVTERGGPKTPIIGFGEIHTMGELSQKIAKELVDQLK
jgi:TolB-like protein